MHLTAQSNDDHFQMHDNIDDDDDNEENVKSEEDEEMQSEILTTLIAKYDSHQKLSPRHILISTQ